MRSTAITQASGGVRLDRNIALELVYATEAAAISAQPCSVGGDKNAADAAAVDAMRACLSTVDIAGRIVTQHSQSRIGLGLAAIGRPAYITVGRDVDLGDPSQRTTSEMQDRAHRLLDAARDAGVRYFDAARSYGHAETSSDPGWPLIRDADERRRLVPNGGVQVRRAVADRRRVMFETQRPQSLQALGATPDIYLIHSVTPDSLGISS